MGKMIVYIQGPVGSPYEGKALKLHVELPNEYPNKAPDTYFKPAIYHCNVDGAGKMCVDAVTKDWNDKKQVSDVIVFINSRLSEPDADHPTVRCHICNTFWNLTCPFANQTNT